MSELKLHRLLPEHMTMDEHKTLHQQIHRHVELYMKALDELRQPNAKQERIRCMVKTLVDGYMTPLVFDDPIGEVHQQERRTPYDTMTELGFRQRVDLLWGLWGFEQMRRREALRCQIVQTLMDEFGVLYVSTEF